MRMNNRGRNLLLIGLFITILAGIFFFGRFLRPSDLNTEQPPIRKTITAIVGLNQTTEAQLHQTETYALIGGFQGTITPTPTLCPPSDVICPGGNATMSPADKVMVLMASASAPEFGRLAQTATALAIRPSPTPTPSVRNSNCAFMWAHQDLPDIATAVQTVLNEAGLKAVNVNRADAYGENCVNSDNSVSYFAAMTTDFYLSATVSDLNDADELAEVVSQSYQLLTTLKITLPANVGYLDIMFIKGSDTKHFRAMISQLRPLIEAGKSGADMIEAGGG